MNLMHLKHINCMSSTPFHGFCGFIFVLSVRWRVSAVFLPELSSVGEFLDFVSNTQRAPLEKLQRNHTVAMPLCDGIGNHAVGHPATCGTQGLHTPSEHAKPFSRTAAMSTTGFSNLRSMARLASTVHTMDGSS